MTKADPTTTAMDVPAQDFAMPELDGQLSSNLPGLSDADLQTLVAKVSDELELRVGTLSDGLTPAQLDEFEMLMDAGDEARCRAWLLTTRPDYRATVMTVRAQLVAEVVQTVLAVDPSAALGRRDFAQAFPLSMDIIATQLDSDGLNYTRTPESGLKIGFTGSESLPEFVVDISQPDSGMLWFFATAPGLVFGPEAQPRLQSFVDDWNVKTWLPKARVVTFEDAPDDSMVAAEIAVPLGVMVTGAVVDAMLRRCLESMIGYFRAAVQRLVVSAP